MDNEINDAKDLEIYALNTQINNLRDITIQQAHTIDKLELRLDACLYSMVMMQSLLKCHENNNREGMQYVKNKNTGMWEEVKLAT